MLRSEWLYRLTENGVRVPSFRTLRRAADVPTNWAGTVVLKPEDGREARGCVRLLNRVRPEWAFEQALRESPSGRVLAERWLDGEQVMVAVGIERGEPSGPLAAARKNMARLNDFAPYCISDGYDGPWGDESQRASLRELAATVADALKIRTGELYLELAWHREMWWVLEARERLRRTGLAEGPTGESAKSWRCVWPLPGDTGRRVERITARPKNEVSWRLRPGAVAEAVTHRMGYWAVVMARAATWPEAAAKADLLAAETYAEVKLEKVENDEEDYSLD